ncbi:MAG TPA: Ppx/GppA phosphatase family protein [Pirellulales bacterium]|jgi:exopolyphosphatase/guanosine-5'-triphosphate,3'-diphosphate pyrophosphatase
MEDKQFFLSPDLAYRLAAIDIGTNSIRLMIVEPHRDGTYRILDEEKETTRLGKNLAKTRRLDPGAVEASLDALRRMKQIAAGFQAREVRVIATCAVREAKDGNEFCRRAKEEIGLDVEVISGEQEARLAFYSVARNFQLAGKNVAIADIGGGSTEIILASGEMIEAIHTTPLGAVRLTDEYLGSGETHLDDFERMLKAIDRKLHREVKKRYFVPHLLIGSGGTFTTLADMVMASKGQTGLPLRAYEVTHAEVRHLLDRLRKMPAKARRGVPGLSSDRADIIVAGLAIVDRLMRRFKVNRLQVHNRGIRDGLVLTMIDTTLGTISQDPHDQDAAIDRFAIGCGVDVRHGSQVARLAGSIFSQLRERWGLRPEDRSLLETAARLQDVGYLIDYDKHHKHSYHLILNSRLAGFRPLELELIANIARYHRGGKPKAKHANYERLTAPDQERVRRLAAILRVAGGLDRSHSQQVRDVELEFTPGAITMYVISEELPEVDLWGARRRCEFFQWVFDVQLTVEWRAPQLSRPKNGNASSETNGAATNVATGEQPVKVG